MAGGIFGEVGRSWMVAPDNPRIVLDASCVTRINHESHVSWQAQYLVKLDGDS